MRKIHLRPELTSSGLHLLAMGLMLLDHMGKTVIDGQEWMQAVGRMAFPLFAFLLVEGFYHTGNIRRYFLRMFVFALISEIPFDLMVSGTLFYPLHQNVMWTFLIALAGMWGIGKAGEEKEGMKRWLLSFMTVVGTILLGFLTLVDYFGFGVMTVYIFYFFHGRKWWQTLCRSVLLFCLNQYLIGGRMLSICLGGLTADIAVQSFAVLAMIPILFYKGRQGIRSRSFRYVCYAFYPVHCLGLALLAIFA